MIKDQDALYRCVCSQCGYETPSLIDWNTQNTPCVKCGGEYYAEKAVVYWQIKAEAIQPEFSVKIISKEGDK